MDVGEKLRQGILAAKSGEKEKAHKLLLQVVETDEKQIQAWLWLSYVVEDLDDKEICLENILALEPNNELAKKGMNRLAKQRLKASVASLSAIPAVKAPEASAPPPEIDQDAKNSASLYLSARKYARLGMWGKALVSLPPLTPSLLTSLLSRHLL